MLLFRRLAISLALCFPVMPAVNAQSTNYSSSNPTLTNPVQDQDTELAQNQPSTNAQQTPGETQGQISVQERIRQRRAQRRSTAIHDAYDHRWETYLDTGYLRFQPGPGLVAGKPLQKLTYYAWETGLTRFSTERLGYSVLGRGYYGTAFVGLNQFNITRPAISQYDVLAGPVYRFYLQPKWAISGRAMAGWAHGNFSGDTNRIPPADFGLYSDADTFAASASVIGELNISPNLALKLAPEYFFTTFGSSLQASRGFTGGLIYRWGKQ
ncbi:MAG TPA: hypothetical protein VMT38_01735 [Terracidiphilus sp.]|nr:hypothetical protein [Terracidiphilus sp.]